MATAVKNIRTLQASASNTAGSTTTSSTWNLATALGGVLSARITNGATGPTIACTVTVNLSTDGGTTWRAYDSALAGVTNAGVFDFDFPIPDGIANVQAVFTGNTAQTVTVEAFGHELTSIA
jgi:hypothetical protein